MTDPEKRVDRFMTKYSAEVAELGRAAYGKLRALIPSATVLVYDNYNALAIGFGPGERASEAILSVVLYPRWVSLFFLQGAKLPDPGRLLTGSGKQARHRVLPDADELDRPEVRALIATALDRAKVPIDPGAEGRVIIKSASATQ